MSSNLGKSDFEEYEILLTDEEYIQRGKKYSLLLKDLENSQQQQNQIQQKLDEYVKDFGQKYYQKSKELTDLQENYVYLTEVLSDINKNLQGELGNSNQYKSYIQEEIKDQASALAQDIARSVNILISKGQLDKCDENILKQQNSTNLHENLALKKDIKMLIVKNEELMKEKKNKVEDQILTKLQKLEIVMDKSQIRKSESRDCINDPINQENQILKQEKRNLQEQINQLQKEKYGNPELTKRIQLLEKQLQQEKNKSMIQQKENENLMLAYGQTQDECSQVMNSLKNEIETMKYFNANFDIDMYYQTVIENIQQFEPEIKHLEMKKRIIPKVKEVFERSNILLSRYASAVKYEIHE